MENVKYQIDQDISTTEAKSLNYLGCIATVYIGLLNDLIWQERYFLMPIRLQVTVPDNSPAHYMTYSSPKG